jgi:hypothetical protein
MLFKKIIAVYSGNHTKLINALCGQNSELLFIKSGGTYSYHKALKGQTTWINLSLQWGSNWHFKQYLDQVDVGLLGFNAVWTFR